MCPLRQLVATCDAMLPNHPHWGTPAYMQTLSSLFGGRRTTTVPLVSEALDWRHGTFLGSVMGSEKTAAAAGKIGELRWRPR